jgi:LysR family transcriptional regulator, regulator for bpeEF and oprC
MGKTRFKHSGDILTVKIVVHQDIFMMQSTLRVQVPAALGRVLIAPSLPRFVHSYPNVRVLLSESSPAEQSLAVDVDAAIRIGPVHDSRLVARPLGIVRTLICAAPEFIEGSGRPVRPSDLTPDKCIALLEPHASHVREWCFTREESAYTISPAATLAFSDAASAIAAAVRGAGYVRVFDIEADREIAAGLLYTVLEDWCGDVEPVTLVHRQDRLMCPEIVAFATFVAGLFPLVTTPPGSRPLRAGGTTDKAGGRPRGGRTSHQLQPDSR